MVKYFKQLTNIYYKEPTTGLDPSSRKKIWNIIQKVKKNRAIILTTHSMEEVKIKFIIIKIMFIGRNIKF